MDLGPPGDGPNNGPIPIQTAQQQVVPPDILHSMLGFLRKYGYTVSLFPLIPFQSNLFCLGHRRDSS